jgi:hypothetical protein
LRWEKDEVTGTFACVAAQGHWKHTGHDNAAEWDQEMDVARKNATIRNNYMAIPGLSLTKAASAANQQAVGGVKIDPATKKRIQRAASNIFSPENEERTVISFFERNNCRYRIVPDVCVCWSSPAMQKSAELYQDPLHFDSTHNIPIEGLKIKEKKAQLFQFVTPSKERKILVVAQALAYGESEAVTTVILKFIHELLGEVPPGVIISDDAAGFRKAVHEVWPKAIHKSCGYHLIVNWNKRFSKFHNPADVQTGKILLRKCATSIDILQSKKYWEELETLCEANLSEKHSEFIAYYRDSRSFWTLEGIPKNMYVGDSFANSITESANDMVKEQDIVHASSTLRVIYIACATFDPSVISPDVMTCPPIISAKLEVSTARKRAELLKTLKDCSAPVKWSDVPDKLTNLCLEALIRAFRQSNSLTAVLDAELNRCFKITQSGSTTDAACHIVALSDSHKKLLCLSCNYFSLHGSPCPHVLTALKCFRMSEENLPFIARNLRAEEAEGDDMNALYSGLPISDEAIGRLVTVNDLISAEDVEQDPVGKNAIDDGDESFPKFEHIGCDATEGNGNLEFSRELKLADSRRSSVARNLELANEDSAAGLGARKALKTTLLVPLIEDALTQKELFIKILMSATSLRDQHAATYKKLFPAKARKGSSLKQIGNAENLKPSAYIPEIKHSKRLAGNLNDEKKPAKKSRSATKKTPSREASTGTIHEAEACSQEVSRSASTVSSLDVNSASAKTLSAEIPEPILNEGNAGEEPHPSAPSTSKRIHRAVKRSSRKTSAVMINTETTGKELQTSVSSASKGNGSLAKHAKREKKFVVEKFVKYNPDTKRVTVKWENYPEHENSEEPIHELKRDLPTTFHTFWKALLHDKDCSDSDSVDSDTPLSALLKPSNKRIKQ